MSEQNCVLLKYFTDTRNVDFAVFPKGNKYLSILKTAWKYRNFRPQVGILPLPDYPKLTSLFLYLLGTEKIYGRTGNDLLSKILINKPCKNIDESTEHVGLSSIRLFDPSIKSLKESWYPKFNKDLLGKIPVQGKGANLFIELSNNRKTSQLNQNKLVDILKELHRDYKFKLLISVKANEKEKAKNLVEEITKLNIDYMIYTTNSLPEFISYVNSADVILTGDGGIGHIAGALDKKVVALYGGNSIVQWGILSKTAIHLYDEENVNNIDNNIIIEQVGKCLACL